MEECADTTDFETPDTLPERLTRLVSVHCDTKSFVRYVQIIAGNREYGEQLNRGGKRLPLPNGDSLSVKRVSNKREANIDATVKMPEHDDIERYAERLLSGEIPGFFVSIGENSNNKRIVLYFSLQINPDPLSRLSTAIKGAVAKIYGKLVNG